MLCKVYCSHIMNDASCIAYWDTCNNHFYEGNDFIGKKFRGCIAGRNNEFFFLQLKYETKYNDGRGCWGFMCRNVTEEGWITYDIYRTNYSEMTEELVGYIKELKTRNGSIWEIAVWRPEYSGWSFVGTTQEPTAGAAFVLLMEDELKHYMCNELFFTDNRLLKWKVGESAPKGTPEPGTRWIWPLEKWWE